MEARQREGGPAKKARPLGAALAAADEEEEREEEEEEEEEQGEGEGDGGGDDAEFVEVEEVEEGEEEDNFFSNPMVVKVLKAGADGTRRAGCLKVMYDNFAEGWLPQHSKSVY